MRLYYQPASGGLVFAVEDTRSFDLAATGKAGLSTLDIDSIPATATLRRDISNHMRPARADSPGGPKYFIDGDGDLATAAGKVVIATDTDKADISDKHGVMNARLASIMADPGNTVTERKQSLVDLAQILRRVERALKKQLDGEL